MPITTSVSKPKIREPLGNPYNMIEYSQHVLPSQVGVGPVLGHRAGECERGGALHDGGGARGRRPADSGAALRMPGTRCFVDIQ